MAGNCKNLEFQISGSDQHILASGLCSTPPKSMKSVLVLFAKCFESFGIIYTNLPELFLKSGCDTQFWRKSHIFARTRNLKTLLPKRKAGNFPVKSGRFLCFWGVSRNPQKSLCLLWSRKFLLASSSWTWLSEVSGPTLGPRFENLVSLRVPSSKTRETLSS